MSGAVRGGGAADRTRLMLVLVPYVLERGEVPLREAASTFGLSEAEVERLFRLLPFIGSVSDGDSWSMPQDMFDIDWDLLENERLLRITQAVAFERAPRLSARETAALVAGLQLVAAMPGAGDSRVVAGLRAKLARGANATPAEVIIAPAPVDEVRQTVADAIARGVAVRFAYKGPDAPVTTRTVDPVTVHFAAGQWYLQGWCHLREAMRTFHLERVSDVEVTDIAAEHGADVATPLFAGIEGAFEATIRYPAHLEPALGAYLTGADVDRAVSSGNGDEHTATLRLSSPAGLRRLASRFGGELEIVAPPALRAEAAAWAGAALDLYPHRPR